MFDQWKFEETLEKHILLPCTKKYIDQFSFFLNNTNTDHWEKLTFLPETLTKHFPSLGPKAFVFNLANLRSPKRETQ